MANAPSYLLLSRHSVYYFRVVVPDVLRPLIQRKEIRRSLQTRCKREAMIRARDFLAQVQQLFTEAFQGNKPALERLHGAWETGGTRLHGWASWLRQQRLVELCEALDLSSRSKQLGHQASTSVLLPEKPSYAPKLSEVQQELDALQAAQGVKPKTLQDKQAVTSLLIDTIGDMPVDLVTRKDALEFKAFITNLPPRRHHRKPADPTIEAEAGETISITTLNNYLKMVSSLFNFAAKAAYCKGNPFEGLQIKQRRKVNQERQAFTEEDLRQLFSSESYPKPDDPRPHKYWLPLLGLYTGARMNELCQLYLDDVVSPNGLDCIHFRESRADQSLKTVTSERMLPIHSKLKALGFLEYVEKQRQAGHERLFPELTRHSKHGYAHAASKWFARLRERLGLKGEGVRKDFHSFRHTVADHLKQQGTDEALVAGVLGHQAAGITFSRYGKDYRPEVLLPVVEKITLAVL
ncbi:DUF6538 domain-containing protein [Halopseudomonas sp.]|uniref:DUF6538 domain-containing protein n=1 Tax=Halopseudomonas sp. TaxID=2901191 RepID=UPI0039E3AA8A